MDIETNIAFFVSRTAEFGETSWIKRAYGKKLERKDILVAKQLEILGDFYDQYTLSSVYLCDKLIDRFYQESKIHTRKVNVSLGSLENNIYKAEALVNNLCQLN
jgi:hypothetical protein